MKRKIACCFDSLPKICRANKFVFFAFALFYLCIANPVIGQLTISEGTIFSGSEDGKLTVDSSLINLGDIILGEHFVLSLNGDGEIKTTQELDVPILVMNGVNYELDGNINVEDSLLMEDGTITPIVSATLLVKNNGTARSVNQSYVDGTLYSVGQGLKFFPVGTNDIYTPVVLNEIEGDAQVKIGVTANNFDLGFSGELPNVLASTNWFWTIDVEGDLEGAKISLPILTEDQMMFDENKGMPIVLQSEGPGLGAENLGSEFEEGDSEVTSILPATKSFALLGVSLEVDPIIHNIITAGEDVDNPFLVIDNIDALDGNEVSLIDRWGNVVFQENDFKNYNESDNLYQGEFDELSSGNYVCIVKYQDKSFNQMVTVIKE